MSKTSELLVLVPSQAESVDQAPALQPARQRSFQEHAAELKLLERAQFDAGLAANRAHRDLAEATEQYQAAICRLGARQVSSDQADAALLVANQAADEASQQTDLAGWLEKDNAVQLKRRLAALGIKDHGQAWPKPELTPIVPSVESVLVVSDQVAASLAS